MELLLSVALNHSVWAAASLQVPSGGLEGEQDDVHVLRVSFVPSHPVVHAVVRGWSGVVPAVLPFQC